MRPVASPVLGLFLALSPALFAAALPPPPAPAGAISKEQQEFFEKKIAPIFSETCYKCHSAAEKTKGGLALDSRNAILKGGDDGAIFVAGDPGKSMILQRVTSKDADEKMPPKDGALTAAQVADLTQWIKLGAAVPDTIAKAVADDRGPIKVAARPNAKSHWAWQPVRVPAQPVVKNAAWVKTPVDLFIESKLESKGLTPSAPADKATLIRRAYFDLVGLPPMPWEVQAFVDDKTPNAWEKVVDRLLASPRYGERWGRFWLDVARYSDTKGESGKKDSPLYVDAWTYRDYVIDSFNQDKPYDRFIMEQIAADKLNLGTDKRPLAALGFLTLGDRFNGNANDVINDRIDVVSKGFLGLTVSCARCHDHMFDPIPQKDYYSLHGIFASTVEPKENPIIAAQGDAKLYQDYLKARQDAMAGAKKYVQEEIASARSTFRAHAAELLMASQVQGKDRQKFIQASGLNAKEMAEVVQFMGPKAGGPGARRGPVMGPFYAFAQLPADKFAEKAGPLAAEIAKGSTARGPVNPKIAALFREKSPTSLDEVAALYGAFFKDLDKTLGTPAATAPVLASAVSGLPKDQTVQELRDAPFTAVALQELSGDDVSKLLPQKAGNRYQQLMSEVSRVELTHPGAPRRAMAVEDGPKSINSPVFIRGEAQNKGEIVPHRFLEILSGPNRPEFKNGSGRLELAQAIASKTNPLTARVMVNRIWLHHFGEGIVTTPDDFGTMSGAPSHPELLDYLSLRFMQSGWSVKAMHKLIMQSAVYQQSSETNDAFARIDPDNQYLWRANIRRLDFEPVRDSLLYIAGKLDLKVGGQPVNILAEPYSLRRSVYAYIDRRDLPEMMNHFDFANPGLPLGKRHETTVPQQALFMMNSPLMIEVARKLLARPEMAQAKDDSQRVHALYWMIFQRPPKPEETQLGLGYITAAGEPADPTLLAMAETPEAPASAAGKFGKGKAAGQKKFAAAKRYGFELQNTGEKVERKALSPWEKYTHALLMANETVYYN